MPIINLHVIRERNINGKKMSGLRTMIRHVERGESGIGVTEHSLNGVISINSTPTATRLPHSVKYSAYFQGIVAVTQCDSLILNRARVCAHISASNQPNAVPSRT